MACFGSMSMCTVKRHPVIIEAFGWIWQNVAPIHFRIPSAALLSTGSHTCTHHSITSTRLYRWWGMPHITSSSFSSSFSSFISSPDSGKADSSSIWLQEVASELTGFVTGFLAFLLRPLVLLCLTVTVDQLYLLWWSRLLIVDSDTDTPTSWRVFLIWLTVVNGFFFTRERIRRSSPSVVFRGLPDRWLFMRSPVCSAFLRMDQMVDLATPNVFAISLMDLFSFFSLMMDCFTGRESSLDFMLNVNSNRLSKQMPQL